MSNLELLKETSSLIRQDLKLETEKIDKISDFDALKVFLSGKIRLMLSNRLQELMNLLYRIDIDEKKVKDTFKLLSEEDISERLAELVIERELKKVETRRLYR